MKSAAQFRSCSHTETVLWLFRVALFPHCPSTVYKVALSVDWSWTVQLNWSWTVHKQTMLCCSWTDRKRIRPWAAHKHRPFGCSETICKTKSATLFVLFWVLRFSWTVHKTEAVVFAHELFANTNSLIINNPQKNIHCSWTVSRIELLTDMLWPAIVWLFITIFQTVGMPTALFVNCSRIERDKFLINC